MNISSSILVGLVLAALSTVADAQSATCNGRVYEVVPAQGITWADANAQANLATEEVSPGLFIQGHLATINSPDENICVSNLNVPPGNRPHVWVGGSQAVGSAEPRIGWTWINGETIAQITDDTPPFNLTNPYTNWQLGQPDNSNSSRHLAINPATLGGGWADSRPQDVWGYVIEYGEQVAPFSATLCKAGGPDPGCKVGPVVGNGSRITLPPIPPPGIPAGAEFVVTTFLIKNDAARCGVDRLTLFGGDVVVPKYLCGHPDFVVAKVETIGTGFEINQGVVDILNGNELLADLDDDNLGCEPSGVDRTEADVVGYQSSEGALEKEFQTGIDDIFVGSTGEFTTECGSSRGTGTGRSYYFAGLRIFPGVGNDAVTNPIGNLEFRFKLLTYKLDVLAKAVSNACGDKAFSTGVCSSLTSQIKVLKGDITNGNATEAKAHLKNLQKTLQGTKFTIMEGKNHPGELTSRTKNFAFTLNKFFP